MHAVCLGDSTRNRPPLPRSPWCPEASQGHRPWKRMVKFLPRLKARSSEVLIFSEMDRDTGGNDRGQYLCFQQARE